MSSLMTHFWFLSVCFLREKEEGSFQCLCVCGSQSLETSYLHTMPDQTIKQSDYTSIMQLQINFLFKLDAHPTAFLISPKTETVLLSSHPEVPFVENCHCWQIFSVGFISLGISFSPIVPTWPDVYFSHVLFLWI